jgi:ATP adenylyltransferase
MERMWRPWRIRYIEAMGEKKDDACIFCTKPRGDDRESLILHRGERCFVMLNLYPYNTGHVMVSPYRHLASLEELDPEEQSEMMRLASLCLRAIRRAMKPEGFNLGMNLGRVAGAGYDGHVHLHIVPRWQGDTNFMPIVADTKVMPESVEDSYRRLRVALKEVLGEDGSA